MPTGTILHVQFLVFKVYLAVEEGDEVVEHLAVNIAQGVFVLGILADECDPFATCGDIILVDALLPPSTITILNYHQYHMWQQFYVYNH